MFKNTVVELVNKCTITQLKTQFHNVLKNDAEKNAKTSSKSVQITRRTVID